MSVTHTKAFVSVSSSGAAGSRSGSERLALIDALKAFGSQFIVLHHLAFYGPMSDWTLQIWPAIVTWFSQDARMAVQVFLVVAGFLAARGLAPDLDLRSSQPGRLIWRRYARVALPYMAALVVAWLCTELARFWMAHDSLPEEANWQQWVAHALLLQSVLDMDSLSAGVWYVAIDFQLYAFLVVLLWLSRAMAWRWMASVLVGLGVLASLFYFNRDSAWDVWALYFFGAYGLGVMTAWATRPLSQPLDRSETVLRSGWLLLLLATLVSLGVDFRERIALALMVALLLGAAHMGGWLGSWPRNRLLAYLGRISYSVFLLNFPVALVVNAAFTRYAPHEAGWQTAGVLVAWLACNVLGAAFHHGVEVPLGRLWSRRTGSGR